MTSKPDISQLLKEEKSAVFLQELSMSSNKEKTRLLLVDDHAIVRAGFRYLLESDADYEILEADSAEEACKVYGDYKPDAVIMDLMMPGMGGSKD